MNNNRGGGDMYTRLQQQQQQQQRLYAHQEQQQHQQQQQPPYSLSTLDPSLLTLQYVKEEYPAGFIDPSDPFALHNNDYDMLSGPAASATNNTGGGGAHGHHSSNNNNMLSPLSTSPLDGLDYDGPMDDSVGSVGSLSTHSQFGSTPATTTGGVSGGIPLPGPHHSQHHFYSMSMPVRTAAGFSTSTPSQTAQRQRPQQPSQAQAQQQALAGSQASSYQSYASTSGSGVPPMSVLRGDQESFKHLDILNEKRRRRRESHNLVERRRRDHINEKIAELSLLLPEFAGDAQNKPNKGTVLKRSVDYLRHIQAFAAKQIERNKELEHVLSSICAQRGIDLDELGLSVPLGTPIEIPPMASETPSENMDEQDE